MKGEDIKKVMGSNPEYKGTIMGGWTEKDGIWTLERGGVEVARIKNETPTDYVGSYTVWIAGERLAGDFFTLAMTKSAVEEILSLLQPKAEELVWDYHDEPFISSETLMANKLKPCAHCESKAELRDDGIGSTPEGDQPYWVQCTDCGASTNFYYTAEDATEAWNTRPSGMVLVKQADIDELYTEVKSLKRNVLKALQGEG